VDAAVGGEVVYLTRAGQRVAAVVPPDVAAAGQAAVTALEDAADLRDARRRLAESRLAGEEPISHETMLDWYQRVLAAHPANDQ
jgi:hypothetical protein